MWSVHVSRFCKIWISSHCLADFINKSTKLINLPIETCSGGRGVWAKWGSAKPQSTAQHLEYRISICFFHNPSKIKFTDFFDTFYFLSFSRHIVSHHQSSEKEKIMWIQKIFRLHMHFSFSQLWWTDKNNFNTEQKLKFKN